MSAYLFIALSVSCSLIIAHLLKATERSNVSLLHVLTINYFVAATVSFFTNQSSYADPFIEVLPTLSIGLFLGILFIANFFLYSICIQKIGMGVSIAAMRLSLIIPIIVSVFVFGEFLTLNKYLAIGIVFLAFALMLPRNNEELSFPGKILFLPVLLFLFNGVVDAVLKIYERQHSHVLSEELFLAFIFFTAFLVGLFVLIYKGELKFTKREFVYGVLIGVANLYSTFFLLLALKGLSGALVFSLTNILNVVLGTFIGILIWKDQLTLKQKFGIGSAILAIILLVT
ncbi:MAG: DMT family transporter [Balneolales bacterium]|nr:DMT family transporter [Balneolales bacterium]